MITKQINKIKVELFEEKELKEKFRLNNDEINLIMEYQRHFPELMQKDNGDKTFCIDARSLWNDLGMPQGKFANWIQRKLVNREYVENTDFNRFHKTVKGDKKGYGNISTNEYLLTLDCAKELCMEEHSIIGRMVRKYFILIEKVLKNNDQWCITRTTQKQGYKQMEEHIKQWCIRHEFDYSLRKFYIREANLLNETLFGHPAMEVNDLIDNDDTITRDHLPEEFNLALVNLQNFNIGLLCSNLSFDKRSEMVENMCKGMYPSMKTDFDKFAITIRELRNKQ